MGQLVFQTPAPTLVSSMTLSKSLKLSKPMFSHLSNGKTKNRNFSGFL